MTDHKPIKLDTILLRKIRACIRGDIDSIAEGSAGVFHVVVRRNNPVKVFFRYTIEVKPDTNKGGHRGSNRG